MSYQRRYERVPFFREVGLTVRQGAAPVAARTFDISLGGVGLFTRAHLDRGQNVRVALCFEDAAGNKVVETVAGQVAYLQATEEGNQLGIMFLEPPRADTHPRLVRAIQRL
jgi:c-di-GMP-binding flagellar brake protein YcgR